MADREKEGKIVDKVEDDILAKLLFGVVAVSCAGYATYKLVCFAYKILAYYSTQFSNYYPPK